MNHPCDGRSAKADERGVAQLGGSPQRRFSISWVRTGATPQTVAITGVLLLYLILSFLYNRATPPLEASDEAGHIAHVLLLQQNARLPIADSRHSDVRMSQELAQPPLYYLPAALLIWPVDTSNWTDFFVRRPGAPVGRADIPGPKNMWARGGDRSFPYQRTMLAIQLLRGYSMILGIGTILITVRLSRRLLPADSWAPVFAAALVAFNPMFLFISNSVNNDNLVALLVPCTLLLLLTYEGRLLRPAPAFCIGALTGCALLAKLSAAILLPATAGFMLSLPVTMRSKVRALALWLGGTAASSGWWFVRNQCVYGDLTALNVHAAIAGNLRRHRDPLALIREWSGFIKSYWGVFGGFNVIFSDPVYFVFYAITALGVLSCTAFLIGRHFQVDRGIWLLLSVAGLNVATLALWTARLMGSQGRLLFPSMAAMSVLFSISLSAWQPALRRLVTVPVSLWLVVTAFYGALSVIPAQYP